MRRSYVLALGEGELQGHGGHKAASLQVLATHGFKTPETYVCVWDAYEAYRAQDSAALSQIRAEIAELVRPGRAYAVRSSANLEDGLESSCAGQFTSCLSVEGAEGVYEAVTKVWGSASQESVTTYMRTRGMDPDKVRMAVIVQDMVEPVYSGVAFSRNPITGLDEIVVEAVPGSGEALMQGGVTPSRWIHKWGAWTEKPSGASVPEEIIEQVVAGAKEIAKVCGRDVDVEWVHDGDHLHWVQLRDITSINGVDVYSNHISREMLPGLVKPLVWSMNVPMKSTVWGWILAELLGPNQIDTGRLVGKFYHRAYFNMGVFGEVFAAFGMPRESMELMMGIDLGGPDRPAMRPTKMNMRLVPRLLRTVVRKLTLGRSIERQLIEARRAYDALPIDQVEQLDERALIDLVDRLYRITERVTYYNINVPILSSIYSGLLSSRLKRLGLSIDDLDVAAGLDVLEQFDPNRGLAGLHQLYLGLDRETQQQVATSSYEDLRTVAGAAQLRDAIEGFLRDFGHLSDSTNDFTVAPWRERPDLVLNMLTQFSIIEGSAKHKPWEQLPLSGLRRVLLGPLYRQVRRYRYYRDAVGSLYIYGYGLFRRPLVALGRQMADRGVLGASEDIFYLDMDQVRDIVTGREPVGLRDLVAERKAEMEAVRDIAPPTVIFGDQAPPASLPDGDELRGTPTSRGVYSGPARLVRGIEDWPKLQEGDVLVIPYSDVGWTPLFAKAAAVVAESGGMLSHSSIVAREYGIPAVVSVAGAMTIPDGAPVTVDGFGGRVLIEREPNQQVDFKQAKRREEQPK